MKVICKLFLLAAVFFVLSNSQFANKRLNHQAQQVTDDQLRYLAGLSNSQDIEDILDNILIPRVVGTANHEKVFQYIKKYLSDLDWDVEVDEFSQETPLFGELTFKNIVATSSPNAERYLVLACHYDSKYYENEVFVGATDSAVPCAMLLNMAKVMKKEFDKIKDSTDLGLKLIFFDGEEAFVNWGPNDSIYGAKHLAKKYHDKKMSLQSTGEQISGLDQMDLLVLLDLLGAPNPRFTSLQGNNEKWYIKLVDAENKLHDLGLLTNHRSAYFKKRRSYSRIEDDHLPFLEKNVSILHLITVPFPNEWHTPDDNRDLLDMNVVDNLNKILRVFVAEYLHLRVIHCMYTECAMKNCPG